MGEGVGRQVPLRAVSCGHGLVLVHTRPRVHDPFLLIILLLRLGFGRRLRLLFRKHFVDRVALWSLDDAFEQILREDWEVSLSTTESQLSSARRRVL